MLYYLDTSNHKPIKEFVPRIPVNRLATEDFTTKRICLAKTIEGCFVASAEMENFLSRHERCPDEVFMLYCFDENDIKSENLVDSYELWSKSLVSDAYISGEVWVINQNLIPKEIKYVSVKSYEYDVVASLCFDVWENFDTEYQLHKYFQPYDIPVQKFVDIVDAKLVKSSFDAYIKFQNGNILDTKRVYSKMEFQYYEEEELLFTDEPEVDAEDKYRCFSIFNLSKYFPDINDFGKVLRNGKGRKLSKCIYSYGYNKKGILIFAEFCVAPKQEVLELFLEEEREAV